MKKILSLALALVMILSLSIPASATGSENSSSSAEVKASYTPSTTTTAEAKWGKSEDNLNIGEGTLAQAIAAAAASSEVKYIQLQTSVTAPTDAYRITGGTFTIDLNGQTVSGESYIFVVNGDNANVTFTGSGTVESTGGAVAAIAVFKGKITISGGSYKGAEAVFAETAEDSTAPAEINITGGTFTGTNYRAVSVNDGKLTISSGTFSGGWSAVNVSGTSEAVITGGTFYAGQLGHLNYCGGKLDLSGYNGTTAITDLTVYNMSDLSVTVSDTTIKLPSGYAFYKSDDANKTEVTVLEVYDAKYCIKATGTTTTAVITGVSIAVKDASGNDVQASNNVYTIKQDYTVTVTVTGTNLDKATADVQRIYFGAYDSINDTWTFNADKTTASKEFLGRAFDNVTSATEIKYTNDGITYTGTGIYIQYQANTASVEISWGAMSFVYSDEKVEGTEKGWSCTEGANKVTVENKGEETVNVGIAFKKSTTAANITNVDGAFDKSSATLAKDASDSFVLTLSGKPDGALDEVVIGTVTVTITKAGN